MRQAVALRGSAALEQLKDNSRNNGSLQRDLRLVTLAWVFGSGWLWIASGSVMTQFAKEVGMPDWAFGLLAAIPFIAALVQLPVSWWINKVGQRRTLFLVCGFAGRLLTSVLALVPWILPEQQWAWWRVVLAAQLLSWVLMQAIGPAWLNWMSDLIPKRIRGRYFANRLSIATPVAVLASLGSAWFLDQAGAADSAGAMLRISSILLVVAGIMGTIDIAVFLGVKDPKPRPDPTQAADFTWRSILAPLSRRDFRHFLALNGVMTFAMAFVGQYIWLFALDVLGWSNLKANLMILALPLLIQMFVRGMWGRLCDRHGKKPVLIVSGLLVGVGGLGWVIMSPTQWMTGYVLILVMTVAWPGFELANFNFLMDYAGNSEKSKQGRHTGGVQAVALFSVANACAGGLSGVAAGSIAASLEDWQVSVSIGGIVLTYHGLLLLLSTILRIAALGFTIGLEEPAAKGTRDVIRYLATGVYNNMRTAASSPIRLAGPALRWAYRIDKK